MTRPIPAKLTDGNIDKDGNLKSREDEDEYEDAEDEETLTVPTKSKRKLMPIELL